MIELTVNDMTCGGCVASIIRVVKGLDANATIDADVASIRVKINSVATNDKRIAAIAAAGYHPLIA